MSAKGRWLPLESNPDVLNKYIQTLGVPSEKWQFVDVYGIDPDLLLMVPQPVSAVLLLFPITEKSEESDEQEIDRIKKSGQDLSGNVWFMKQTIGNACGTIGVLHSLANNQEKLGLSPESSLYKFLEKTKNLDAFQRAKELVVTKDIAEAHTESANQGQTKTPELNADINLHFVAFVERDGHLYQLDGRKPFPINHGKTSANSLLEDSCKIIGEFMKRDPTEVNFSMMALVPAVTD